MHPRSRSLGITSVAGDGPRVYHFGDLSYLGAYQVFCAAVRDCKGRRLLAVLFLSTRYLDICFPKPSLGFAAPWRNTSPTKYDLRTVMAMPPATGSNIGEPMEDGSHSAKVILRRWMGRLHVLRVP